MGGSSSFGNPGAMSQGPYGILSGLPANAGGAAPMHPTGTVSPSIGPNIVSDPGQQPIPPRPYDPGPQPIPPQPYDPGPQPVPPHPYDPGPGIGPNIVSDPGPGTGGVMSGPNGPQQPVPPMMPGMQGNNPYVQRLMGQQPQTPGGNPLSNPYLQRLMGSPYWNRG